MTSSPAGLNDLRLCVRAHGPPAIFLGIVVVVTFAFWVLGGTLLAIAVDALRDHASLGLVGTVLVLAVLLLPAVGLLLLADWMTTVIATSFRRVDVTYARQGVTFNATSLLRHRPALLHGRSLVFRVRWGSLDESSYLPWSEATLVVGSIRVGESGAENLVDLSVIRRLRGRHAANAVISGGQGWVTQSEALLVAEVAKDGGAHFSAILAHQLRPSSKPDLLAPFRPYLPSQAPRQSITSPRPPR